MQGFFSIFAIFLRRHNYNKSSVVMLWILSYWRRINHPIWKVYCDYHWLITDEFIERVHSRLRALCKYVRSAEEILFKGSYILEEGIETLRSIYLDEKNRKYAGNTLKDMVALTGEFIYKLFSDCAKNDVSICVEERDETIKEPQYILPNVHGKGIKVTADKLTLAHNCYDALPQPKLTCDSNNCRTANQYKKHHKL